MKTLHAIHAIDTEAWIWHTPIGGNGAAAGRGGYTHLYLTQRGTPTFPVGDRRRGWGDFTWARRSDADPRQPLCGPLRTTARFIHLEMWGWNGHCPDCETTAARLGITPHTFGSIRLTDPWRFVPATDRVDTPDPVTGL